MNICYLLESTELWGGVRVVLDQARALGQRGHEVTVRALAGDHSWYPHPARVEYMPNLAAPFCGSKPDVVIATFWTTVKPALELDCPSTFHLCQGYEGDYAEYAGIRSMIEAAYRHPIPKITVAPWLSELLKGYFGNSFSTSCVGQIVDLDIFSPASFSQRLRQSFRKVPTILIVGNSEVSFKGIPYALKSVQLMREKGLDLNLVRVSPVDNAAKENVFTAINEYRIHLPPPKLAEVYRKSDLFLSPSLSAEGFGLPLAEALASGTPSVATAIPSYLGLDPVHDYAWLTPEKDPNSMADAAITLLKDKKLQNKFRTRGIEVVRRNFRGSAVARRLESVFLGSE